MRARLAAVVLAFSGLGILAGCGGPAGTETPVVDHVHAAAAGTSGSDVYVATHYGLVRSTDGGRTWADDPGLGNEMVGGLIRTGDGFVATLQPMGGPGMAMSPGQSSMPGMSMGAASTPNIGYSTDGVRWTSSDGIPVKATVAALTGGPGPSTVWASLLGRGLYESTDGGQHWNEVIPSAAPITQLVVAQQNLVLSTSSGLFVTGVNAPSMPALPQLTGGINDIATSDACAGCVVAALGSGGIAVSDDAGVSWTQRPSRHVFDEVASVQSEPYALFGMVPAPAAADHGLWKSDDGGVTWTRVLHQPLVDHLYEVPASAGAPASLLAFEWGITVYRSQDGGATWSTLSHFNGS